MALWFMMKQSNNICFKMLWSDYLHIFWFVNTCTILFLMDKSEKKKNEIKTTMIKEPSLFVILLECVFVSGKYPTMPRTAIVFPLQIYFSSNHIQQTF